MTNIDPDLCRVCGCKGVVVKSQRAFGYFRRRHQCVTGCLETEGARQGQPRRWTSFQSRVNPKRAIRRWMMESRT